MANWANPTLTSTYTNFVSEITGRDVDLACGLDPAVVTVTTPPTNSIRWNGASAKWQKWSGTAWNDLASSYSVNIAGTVTAPAGAVGTPSLTFAGSTTTGLYSPGTNQVALAVAGTQRMLVTSAGRFSFGAGASPVAPVTVAGGGLAVQETAVNRALSFVDAAGTTTYASFGADFSGANKITYVTSPQAGSKISLQVAGAERGSLTDTAATMTVPLTLPAQAVSASGNVAATAGLVRAMGAAVNGVSGVTGAATLTSSAIGVLQVMSGTSYTLTLPAASAVPAGAGIPVEHVGSGVIALGCQGTDTIQEDGTAGITFLNLLPGDNGYVYSNGTGVWYSFIDRTNCGTYTPTYSSVTAGLTITNLSQIKWSRVGRIVTVGGIIQLSFSSALSSLNFNMSLPIASNLTSISDVAGGLNGFSDISINIINGNTSLDLAAASAFFASPISSVQNIAFNYIYEVK